MLLLVKHIFYVFLVIIFFNRCCTEKIKLNEFNLAVTAKKCQLKRQIKNNDSLRFVSLKNYIPNIKFDFRYADTNNFTHEKLYNKPIAFLRFDAAQKLKLAAMELEKIGLGLKVFDAYRPYTITKKMWQIVPDENYAANPAKGSGHNRGAAIDLTLYNLTTGEDLLMPTPFDEFSEKAHHTYTQLSEEVLSNRKILKDIMTKYGFVALNTEWWHYSLPDAAKKYNLIDVGFKKMKQLVK